MAIPSGSGTEVLKVATGVVSNSDAEQTPITGVANHIYTILSIIVTETGGSEELLRIYLDDDGSTEIRILNDIPLSAKGTFVFNDKFVLSGTDCLRIRTASAAYYHYAVTYIDQDWS